MSAISITDCLTFSSLSILVSKISLRPTNADSIFPIPLSMLGNSASRSVNSFQSRAKRVAAFSARSLYALAFFIASPAISEKVTFVFPISIVKSF